MCQLPLHLERGGQSTRPTLVSFISSISLVILILILVLILDLNF